MMLEPDMVAMIVPEAKLELSYPVNVQDAPMLVVVQPSASPSLYRRTVTGAT
jgi:hypothetical protein